MESNRRPSASSVLSVVPSFLGWKPQEAWCAHVIRSEEPVKGTEVPSNAAMGVGRQKWPGARVATRCRDGHRALDDGKYIWRVLRSLSLSLLLLGCSAPEVDLPSVSTADSAGVTTVRVHRLDDLDLPTWEANLVFSTASSDSLLLGQFAVALFLPDGSLLVGSGVDLFQLDTDGTLLRRIGRAGDGPGEFRGIGRLLITEDSLIAVSEAWSGPGRMTVMRPDGSMARYIARLGGAVSPAAREPVALLGRGVILSTYGQFMPNRGEVPGIPSGELERDPMPLFVHDSTGMIRDTLGSWLGLERARLLMEGHTVRITVPFARSVVHDGRGGVAVIGPTDSLDLSVYDAGRLTLRITGSAPHRPVTPEHLEEWRGVMQTWNGSDGLIFLDLMRNAPRVPELPAVGAVVVDDQRNLWVGGYASAGDTIRTWTVFSREGVPLARLDLSAVTDPVFHGPHELLDVQGDRLAVLRPGEDGEAIIEVWQLRR